MGFRFRKTFSVAPGIRLNLSGLSTSFGVPGAHVTVGHGVRTTVGLPGSGISYTTVHGGHHPRHRAAKRQAGNGFVAALLWVVILVSGALALLAH